MEHSPIRPWWPALLASIVSVTAASGVSYAQSRGGCGEAIRPSLGAAIGRSSPYFYLATAAVEAEPSASISVQSGPNLSVRGDLAIAGPLRLRVEGSLASWNVERRTYSPEQNFELASTTSAGHVTVRHIGGAVGVRAGRAPACGHVLIGGGLYSLTVRDATLRRPGVAITAGIEIPTGARGRVQVDLQLHIIDTNSRFPISSSKALAAGLLAGWAYNF